MKTETHYFAVMNPESKYASQCDGIPFPVTLSPEDDGYHWSGNSNRYRDNDLVLLFPTHKDPMLEFNYIMHQIPNIEYQEFSKTSRGYMHYPFSHNKPIW